MNFLISQFLIFAAYLGKYINFLMSWIWFSGFVYNEGFSDGRKSRRQLWGEPGKVPWSTITYANGAGFYDHFTNDTKSPWKDIRSMNWKEFDYKSPSLIGVKDESHGGEDVPILAKGPWAHLFTGI